MRSARRLKVGASNGDAVVPYQSAKSCTHSSLPPQTV